MYCRVWFWSGINPNPRIIAHAPGGTIIKSMVNMYVPIGQPGWKLTIEEGDVYIRRNTAGYCGQEVVEGESIRQPRKLKTKERLSLPKQRSRLTLESEPVRKRIRL